MSEGPIHHWWRSHLPPRVSTNPKTATHYVGTWPRAYCGHRGGTQTGEPPLVDCSACVAAVQADIGSSDPS